jgi:hypothetical protein
MLFYHVRVALPALANIRLWVSLSRSIPPQGLKPRIFAPLADLRPKAKALGYQPVPFKTTED